MSGLVEFLLARIAEDEAVARHVVAEMEEGRRQAAGRAPWLGNLPSGAEDTDLWASALGDETPAVVVGPARVLAEVDAKRRIVDLHRPEAFDDAPTDAFCTHDQLTAGVWPCPTIRLLALPYADHDQFREEWRA